jgi:hypothetical protein
MADAVAFNVAPAKFGNAVTFFVFAVAGTTPPGLFAWHKTPFDIKLE